MAVNDDRDTSGRLDNAMDARPDEEHSSGCLEDAPHADFAVFVGAHLNSFFLPVARRYAGMRLIPDAAPDIAQEALARTWPVWATLAREPCRRRCAFVCATMINVAREEQRKRSRVRPTDPWSFPDHPLADAGPEDRCLVSEVGLAVAYAMANLSDNERLIIELAIAGLSRAEIADQLRISRSNVSTRLFRARVRLARYLDPATLAELGLRSGQDPSGGAA